MGKRVTKVNLGAGPSGIDGWDNYDWGMLPILNKIPIVVKILVKLGILSNMYLEDWPKYKLLDIRNQLPYENDEVDFIYCSHVLEHFEKFETKKILVECRRILKNNGIMRVVLPDVQKIILKYETADMFCREFYGYEKDIPRMTNIFVRGHHWMYDKKSFKEMLKDIGFSKVELKRWQKGEVPDLKKLDLKIHQVLSFYYEIKK